MLIRPVHACSWQRWADPSVLGKERCGRHGERSALQDRGRDRSLYVKIRVL